MILSVETATEAMLELARSQGLRADAAQRAAGDGAWAWPMSARRPSPDHPVEVRHCDWLDRDAARALADPALDFDRGPIGPLEAVPVDSPDCARAALTLARLAGLLPALWLVGDRYRCRDRSRGNRRSATAAPVATIVARAKLPLDDLPPSQMVAFRDPASGEEHVALLVGAFGGKPPLIRLHSECLTGDVFGSLKCDCGPQLKEALRLLGAGRRRGAALPAPGRPRDRSRQQAARLCAPGPRARHGRSQPPAGLRRRRAQLWHGGGDAAGAGYRPGARC